MLDAVFARVQAVADGWAKEVAKRRRLTNVDPVADTLEYAAGELSAELEQLREDCRMLTPEQFAQLRAGGVTPQAVRNWIKNGELEAYRTPRGWQIPAAAERRKKEHAA